MSLRHPFDAETLKAPLHDAIIIGHVTTNEAKIWVRGKYQGEYFVLLSELPIKPRELSLTSGGERTELESLNGVKEVQAIKLTNKTDRTGVVKFDKLNAGTRYYAALAIKKDGRARRSWRVGYEREATFKTKTQASATISFGFFSCHDPFYKGHGSTEIFEVMKDHLNDMNASLVIAGGDQVYVDSSVKKHNIWKWVKENKEQIKNFYPNRQAELQQELAHFYRFIYRKYWGINELQELLMSFPTYMVWDDHEILDGWGSYTDKELSNELDTIFEWENPKLNLFIAKTMFLAAKQVYEEYQHSHNPDTPQKQWDYSFECGELGYYVLESRGHHKFKVNNDSNLLGKNQMKRFEDWLKKEAPRKKALFIVSPVPVLHWSGTIVNIGDIGTFKDDFRDEWDHETNHKERNIMLDAVFKASHEHRIPVVFLSGDVHCAASYRLARAGSNGKVFQLTSSGVTRAMSPEALKFLTCEKGHLQGEADNVKTRFVRESFHTRNNFATLRVDMKTNDVKIVAEHVFYDEDDDTVTTQRIRVC